MTSDLVCQALNNAIKYKRPAKGLIVHSIGDNIAVISTAKSFKSVNKAGSMSRKALLRYAPIESFWGQLKNGRFAGL